MPPIECGGTSHVSKTPIDTLTLRRPDDFHVHLRDGPALAAVAAHTAQSFARAIVMPNLRPPVTTVAAAAAYRDRIRAAMPPGARFTPLMTLYLTDNTPASEIAAAKASGFVHAVKYYPAGATTNSDSGVTSIERVYPVLEAMQKHGLVLCLHGEVTDPDVDMFDRERVFVDTLLRQVTRDFPALRIVLEHVTTSEAAHFVRDATTPIAATITPQHLRWSRSVAVRRRAAAAFLLPADPEARIASPGARRGGNVRAIRGSSSAPIRRRTRVTRRKRRAAAPAAIRRPLRLRFTPRSSTPWGRSTS